jgi:hypothetical protein
MTLELPPLALTEPPETREAAPEVAVASDASPLDFLCAVYRDPAQPMARRMRAAEAALPFCHPKLAVTAVVGAEIGEQLEARLARVATPVIEAKPSFTRRV